MRSPDNRRVVAESALRTVALVAMTGLAARLWSGDSVSTDSATVSRASLDSALTAWTVAPPSQAILVADPLPGPAQRDWMVALRRSGLAIDWRTADSSHVALVAEAGVRQPTRLTALGPPASTISVADDLGVLDSANTGDDGVAAWRASPVGGVRATIGVAVASAEPRDSLVAKPVLVIGQAGWEAKFVVAALEETGWSVSTRLAVAPNAIVRQGPGATIDTASFSAVIVLDSVSDLSASAMSRFIRDGGGVVAAGTGVNHPAMRTILPRSTASIPGEIGALLGPSPKEGLLARRLRSDSSTVTLDRRASVPTVLAHRLGAGRAIAVGYDDTWRLRLAPPDESAPEMHRAWWSSLVAGVARVALVRRETGQIDEAPLAATIDRLGAPTAGDSGSPGNRIPWTVLLAALAGVALLAEWLSRRLRGVA